MRSDAAENAERVLRSTVTLLETVPDASLEEIAAAAQVSRATVYRHFGSRAGLLEAARLRASDERDPPRTVDEDPSPLDVTEILNRVPPHLLGDQIVSEARRLAGVTSAALYLIDLEGAHLLRLAGSEEFPATLDIPLAVGPALPPSALPALRALVERELPGSVLAPLSLRGRTLGILLAVDAPEQALATLARQAAIALAVAEAYTDVFDSTRRRRETSPAAEIQQNLLPPRIARFTGAVVAGNVLPGYDFGGDWFDYAENRDGAWLGVADSMGRGTTAAALGAIALGAFRAKRKVTGELGPTVLAMHHAIQEVAVEGAFVDATIARWHGPSATCSWITCGGPCPLLIDDDGAVTELPCPAHERLGLGGADRVLEPTRRRLAGGQRLVLVSDGVLDRRTRDGGVFGLDGIRAVASRTLNATPPETVRALEDALAAASKDGLEDDATIVVLAPTRPS